MKLKPVSKDGSEKTLRSVSRHSSKEGSPTVVR
jgi:hypothetical protein